MVKDTQGQWPSYDKSAPKPKQTEAGSDKEIAEWMDELHDIHGLIKVAEYDDLKKMSMEMESIVSGRPSGAGAPVDNSEGDDADFLQNLKQLKVD